MSESKSMPTPCAPRPLAFFIGLGIALLVLTTSSLLHMSAGNELKKVQTLVETHADQINLRNNAQQKLNQLNTIYDGLIEEYQKKGEDVDWNITNFKQLKEDREKAAQSLNGFSTLSELSGFEHALSLAEQKQAKYLKLGNWSMLSILIPILFLYLPFYKAQLSRYERCSIHIKALSFLLCLPFFNSLNYLYLSVTWNLDGVQRKNAFIVTMPISLAFLFCQGLAIYHFQNRPHLSLYSLTVCCVLWAVVHFRFYQMENYRFKNLSKMHY